MIRARWRRMMQRFRGGEPWACSSCDWDDARGYDHRGNPRCVPCAKRDHTPYLWGRDYRASWSDGTYDVILPMFDGGWSRTPEEQQKLRTLLVDTAAHLDRERL